MQVSEATTIKIAVTSCLAMYLLMFTFACLVVAAQVALAAHCVACPFALPHHSVFAQSCQRQLQAA
jgi:hypothetical protein